MKYSPTICFPKCRDDDDKDADDINVTVDKDGMATTPVLYEGAVVSWRATSLLYDCSAISIPTSS